MIFSFLIKKQTLSLVKEDDNILAFKYQNKFVANKKIDNDTSQSFSSELKSQDSDYVQYDQDLASVQLSIQETQNLDELDQTKSVYFNNNAVLLNQNQITQKSTASQLLVQSFRHQQSQLVASSSKPLTYSQRNVIQKRKSILKDNNSQASFKTQNLQSSIEYSNQQDNIQYQSAKPENTIKTEVEYINPFDEIDYYEKEKSFVSGQVHNNKLIQSLDQQIQQLKQDNERLLYQNENYYELNKQNQNSAISTIQDITYNENDVQDLLNNLRGSIYDKLQPLQ